MTRLEVKFGGGTTKTIVLDRGKGDNYIFSTKDKTLSLTRHSTRGMMVPSMFTDVESVTIIGGSDEAQHPSRDSFEKK